MSLINSFIDYLRGSKPTSAKVAKERLQLILAHGGGRRGIPEYLPALRHDLIAVIAKYIPIDPEQIKMDFNRQGDYDLLELNIVLPEGSRRVQRPAG